MTITKIDNNIHQAGSIVIVSKLRPSYTKPKTNCSLLYSVMTTVRGKWAQQELNTPNDKHLLVYIFLTMIKIIFIEFII